MNQSRPLDGDRLMAVIDLVDDGTIDNDKASELLDEMTKDGSVLLPDGVKRSKQRQNRLKKQISRRIYDSAKR